MYYSKYNAKCTKILDAVIPIKILQTALLGADKKMPVLDGALISASKVFPVTTIIVRNQIYAGKYVTKLISRFGCRHIIIQYWMQHIYLHPK